MQNDFDNTIMNAVAKWCGMPPDEFKRLAGQILVDAMTGLYEVMSKSQEIRDQVRELVKLRLSNDINDLEFSAMLAELAELYEKPKDTRWTPEA